MGFFADQRIKNGQRAVARDDKESCPKDTNNYTNIKPDFMKGNQGQDIPTNQASTPYKMDSDQQKRSKRFPK